MRRLLTLVLVLPAAFAFADPEQARGACAAAVVVDGRILIGAMLRHPGRLPARVGTRHAVLPGCDDTGGDAPDQRTSVVRLRGLPPQVAVAPTEHAGYVYVDNASLMAIGTHPLHAAQYGSSRRPSYRHCRRDRTALRGKVLEDGTLNLGVAGRTVRLGVGAATRFTNRPSYEPVRKGQRLRLATSRCGARQVADRVTFLGATPQPEPYRHARGGRGRPHGPRWPVGLLVLAGSAAALIGVIWRYVGR